MNPVYEITEVPTYQLRRIVKGEGEDRIGLVGTFKTRESAEQYRDELKKSDGLYWDGERDG